MNWRLWRRGSFPRGLLQISSKNYSAKDTNQTNVFLPPGLPSGLLKNVNNYGSLIVKIVQSFVLNLPSSNISDDESVSIPQK